jgi:hypothetical protein
MLNRRKFLISASCAILCAPAVVRAEILMPIRGIILCEDIPHYGFVERLGAHSHMQSIQPLLVNGLSACEIAVELNGRNSKGVNGLKWDANKVLGIIRLDQSIRRSDLLLRNADRNT